MNGMQQKEVVSIIIPAYNVENYIVRTIESCINQTYKKIEILIIDDGSLDNTSKVIQKYVLKDDRIKYFYQENSGVSKARNNGISHANGKYIVFLDSDDWLEKDAIEYLIYHQEKYKECFINVNRQCIKLDGKVLKEKNKVFNEKIKILDTEKFLENFIENNYSVSSSCYKLYSREVLLKNRLRFREDIFHGEDGLFVFEYLFQVNKVLYSNKPLWNILERPDSASREKRFNRKLFTAITAVEKMLELSKGNKNLEKKMRAYLVLRTIEVYLKSILSNLIEKEEEQRLTKIILDYHREFLDEVNFKEKIKFFLILKAPKIILKNLLILKNYTRGNE